MIPDPLLRSIEDPLFTASIGIVSTPRALERAMLAQRSVRDLLAHLSDPDNRGLVLARIAELVAAPHDQRYCHPHDLSIAIYLRVLEICDPPLAAQGAQLVLQDPTFWWARTFALPLAAQPGLRVPVQITEYTPQGTPTLRRWDRATTTPLLANTEMAFAKPHATARVVVATSARVEPPADITVVLPGITTGTVTLAN